MFRTLSEEEVLRVKEKHEKRLLVLANVVGVGIGYKTVHQATATKLCIKVYVEKKIPFGKLAKGQAIPKKLDNIETDVEEVGKFIKAQP
jgi:hypothetical protein